MPMVKLAPGHPTGAYRRGGHVFGPEEQEISEDDEGWDSIVSDPFLIIDNKRLAQRQPEPASDEEPEGEAEPAEHETRSDGTTEVKVTEGGSSTGSAGSGPTNPAPNAPAAGSSAPATSTVNNPPSGSNAARAAFQGQGPAKS